MVVVDVAAHLQQLYCCWLCHCRLNSASTLVVVVIVVVGAGSLGRLPGGHAERCCSTVVVLNLMS